MAAVRCGDQLRRHAHAISHIPETTLQNIAHAEHLRDAPDILVLTLERERGSAGDHLKSRNLRELVDDIFRQPVAEILVPLVVAQIHERKHRDGARPVQFRRRAIADPGDEPIPAPRLRLDKLGVPGVVAERMANIENMGLQYVRLNERVWPQCRQKFPVRDNPSRPLYQVLQQENAFGVSVIRSAPRHKHWFWLSSRNGGNSVTANGRYQLTNTLPNGHLNFTGSAGFSAYTALSADWPFTMCYRARSDRPGLSASVLWSRQVNGRMCIVRPHMKRLLFAVALFWSLPASAQNFVYAVSVAAISTGAVQTSAFSFQFSTPVLFSASPSAPPVHVEQQPAFSVTGAPQPGYVLQDGVLSVNGPSGTFSLAFRNPAGNTLFVILNANPPATFNAPGAYGLSCVPTFSTGTGTVMGDPGNGTLTIAAGAAAQPTLIKSATSLSFLYVPGMAAPSGQVILSSSGASLAFTLSTTREPWLILGATGGTTPSAIQVSIVPYALAPATYTATILISTPGAANPTDMIPVSLTVLSSQAQGPLLTRVSNSASYSPAGAPNSGIAQGSLFVAFGYNMGPATLVQSGYPLTTNLSGTSVSVTVGSTTVDALMVYTSSNQIAAILPSKTPAGAGKVTVAYNGVASSTVPVTVATSSFGTYSISSNGVGPGIITGADYQVKTSPSPARPGETLILWGTGLGPITGDESQRPPPLNQFTPAVFVGNLPAKVLYAGLIGLLRGTRSSEPGCASGNRRMLRSSGGADWGRGQQLHVAANFEFGRMFRLGWHRAVIVGESRGRDQH